MKRLIFVTIIIFTKVGIPLNGSSYSLISQESRFGANAGWDGDIYIYENSSYQYFFAFWKKSLQKIRIHYSFKCQAMNDIGLSWIRSGTLPSSDYLQTKQGKFFETEYYRLNQIDSFILFCYEYNLTPIYLGWPKIPYSYDRQIVDLGDIKDTIYSIHWDTLNDTLSKEQEWYYYWRTLVERYDGDGQGFYTPWGEYVEEATLNDGTHLIIKYWEVTNEAQWHAHWWPGWGKDTIVKFQSGRIDTLRIKDMNEYKLYLHISIQAIKDADSTANIIGPTLNAVDNKWQKLANFKDPFFGSYGNNGKDFWDSLLSDFDSCGVKIISPIYDFDIISIHLDSMPNTINTKFQRLYEIWNSKTEYMPLIGKPIWLTEIAYHADDRANITNPVDTIRANIYKHFLSDFINFKYLNLQKVFFYTIYSWRNLAQSENSYIQLYRFQSLLTFDKKFYNTYDTIREFICRNTPYVHLIELEKLELIPGCTCLIQFDSVFDCFDSSSNLYSTDNSKLTAAIEVSYNDGITWETITQNIAISELGTGFYNWEIPAKVAYRCKLRVKVYDQHNLVGISTLDNSFSIY